MRKKVDDTSAVFWFCGALRHSSMSTFIPECSLVSSHFKLSSKKNSTRWWWRCALNLGVNLDTGWYRHYLFLHQTYRNKPQTHHKTRYGCILIAIFNTHTYTVREWRVKSQHHTIYHIQLLLPARFVILLFCLFAGYFSMLLLFVNRSHKSKKSSHATLNAHATCISFQAYFK